MRTEVKRDLCNTESKLSLKYGCEPQVLWAEG
jgi:hypothetical protein